MRNRFVSVHMKWTLKNFASILHILRHRKLWRGDCLICVARPSSVLCNMSSLVSGQHLFLPLSSRWLFSLQSSVYANVGLKDLLTDYSQGLIFVEKLNVKVVSTVVVYSQLVAALSSVLKRESL